jgi:hypothetical protein
MAKMFFLFSITLFSVNTGIQSYWFLINSSFSETANTLHFMFAFVAMYTAIYNPQASSLSCNFTKFNMFVTLHTMAMLPARCVEKAGKSLIILPNSCHSLNATKRYDTFEYVSIYFVSHLFPDICNIILQKPIKWIKCSIHIFNIALLRQGMFLCEKSLKMDKDTLLLWYYFWDPTILTFLVGKCFKHDLLKWGPLNL